jgi:hypothetical protein
MERAPHARLTQNRGLHSLWHTIPQKSAYDPIGSILKVEIQRFLPEAYAAGRRNVGIAGAIDRDDVRRVITRTMEGGEKAFKDRLDKYGF